MAATRTTHTHTHTNSPLNITTVLGWTAGEGEGGGGKPQPPRRVFLETFDGRFAREQRGGHARFGGFVRFSRVAQVKAGRRGG